MKDWALLAAEQARSSQSHLPWLPLALRQVLAASASCWAGWLSEWLALCQVLAALERLAVGMASAVPGAGGIGVVLGRLAVGMASAAQGATAGFVPGWAVLGSVLQACCSVLQTCLGGGGGKAKKAATSPLRGGRKVRSSGAGSVSCGGPALGHPAGASVRGTAFGGAAGTALGSVCSNLQSCWSGFLGKLGLGVASGSLAFGTVRGGVAGPFLAAGWAGGVFAAVGPESSDFTNFGAGAEGGLAFLCGLSEQSFAAKASSSELKHSTMSRELWLAKEACVLKRLRLWHGKCGPIYRTHTGSSVESRYVQAGLGRASGSSGHSVEALEEKLVLSSCV